MNKETQAQFEWFVRQSIRLSRSDGSEVFGDTGKDNFPRELFESALAIVEDPDDHKIARLALPPHARKHPSSKGLPEPSAHSEWAESAILRTSWRRDRHQLTTTFADKKVNVELESAGHILIHGEWSVQIEVADQPLEVSDHWEEVCWYSDHDLDYIELSTNLSNGWTIERQMVLAREDGFLVLADAILGAGSEPFHYRSELPLAEGISGVLAKDTRELSLANSKKLANVFPLSLPEWRMTHGMGEIGIDGDSRLCYDIQAPGPAVYAATFFDLNSKRIKKPFTWRRLTVAQQLDILPPSKAAGSASRVTKKTG